MITKLLLSIVLSMMGVALLALALYAITKREECEEQTLAVIDLDKIKYGFSYRVTHEDQIFLVRKITEEQWLNEIKRNRKYVKIMSETSNTCHR